MTLGLEIPKWNTDKLLHMRSNLTHEISALVTAEVNANTFPFIEILCVQNNKILFNKSFSSSNSNALVSGSIFDLASLTKPIAIATILLILVDQERLKLDDLVQKYIPEFKGKHKNNITIKHLASHVSGLPATEKLYEKFNNVNDAKARLFGIPLVYEPQTDMLYSCLGSIILTNILERVMGDNISNIFDHLVANPLGLKNCFFKPLEHGAGTSNIAPTKGDANRGIVHDGNARLFNQMGGNAGLFSNMTDLHIFCQMLLNNGKFKSRQILSNNAINGLFNQQNSVKIPPRTIGWEIKTKVNNPSCGSNYFEGAIGHTGFTGNSIWLDKKSETILIALSNRVNISHSENLPAMGEFRKKLHGIVYNHLSEK